jgi:hypothetical protein
MSENNHKKGRKHRPIGRPGKRFMNAQNRKLFQIPALAASPPLNQYALINACLAQPNFEVLIVYVRT